MERGSRRGAAGSSEGRSVAEVQLFREDVVQSIAQPTLVGVVSKVGGDSSENTSASEDEEEDVEDADEVVEEGNARVCWINSEESTEKLGDIRVVDRAFLHGDIVAKAEEPLGQTGTVVDVEMLVDIQLPNGEIVRDVNSRRLRRVRAFALGDYVIHGLWLGRVDEVVDNVTVMFDDDAKCKVLRAEPERLVPVHAMDDTGCPYYPGQKVRSTTASVFKNSRWLKGSWKANRSEGTVIDVEAGSVMVYWIAAGNSLSNNSQSSAVPNDEQDAKKLLPMIYFSHTNWQLGDRSLPPVRMRPKTVVPAPQDGNVVDGVTSEVDPDASVESESGTGPASGSSLNACCAEALQDSWNMYRRKAKQRRPVKREKKSQRKEKLIEYAVLVVNTRTTVDIAWQDGTLSKGIDACCLIPVDHLGDHDFWPEQYVMERGSDGEGLEVEPRRIGIVKSVDAKQRTATVRWLKIVKRPEEPREFESEEVVSVYELVEHPDYSYCLGDVVIRLTPAPTEDSPSLVDDSEPACSSGVEDNSEADVEENEAETPVKENLSNAVVDARVQQSNPEPQDLSWVGVIIGLQDGDIEVAWADGMISKVGPQVILVVNRDLEDSSSAHSSDLEDAGEGEDAASWETVDSSDEINRVDQIDPALWAESIPWEHQQASGNEDLSGAESSSKGSANHDLGDGENNLKIEGSQGYGGPFKLPLVALGIVSRLATGLLGLRGAKKSSDSAGGCRPSSSQALTYPKHGLEEILDGERTLDGQEHAPDTSRRRVVERTPPSSRDAMRMLNDTSLNSTDKDEHEGSEPSPFCEGGIDKKHGSDGHLLGNLESEQDQEPPVSLNGEVEKPSIGELSTSLSLEGRVKHFDSVKDPSDHHYVGESTQPTNHRKWLRKIQQEWSSLQENLPDTIYVRVYEDRMDLLRAVIVGAAGTPYHDGLFCFDLYLPPDYPFVPPVAYYHSGGLRLNPNLYENGRVCLSLLNTWTGKGSEIWHPSTSSILQVLVSIQGLVLNSKPYFNEAYYDRQVGTGEGEKNSLVYNENSFLLSCKSMLYLLRRPPRHFEQLIGEHFRQQGPSILQACQIYLKGAQIGSLKEIDVTGLSHGKFEDQSSAGFKLMLSKLVPKLAAAFAEVGAQLDPAEWRGETT